MCVCLFFLKGVIFFEICFEICIGILSSHPQNDGLSANVVKWNVFVCSLACLLSECKTGKNKLQDKITLFHFG